MFNSLQNAPSLLIAKNNKFVLQKSTSLFLKCNYNRFNVNLKFNNLHSFSNKLIFQRNLSNCSVFPKNEYIYNINKIDDEELQKKNKDFEDFKKLLKETLKEDNEQRNDTQKNIYDSEEHKPENEHDNGK